MSHSSVPALPRIIGLYVRGIALPLLFALTCCSPISTTPAGDSTLRDEPGWSEVLDLMRARDYFTLRDRIENGGGSESLPAQFAQALVFHAFNQPQESNALIEAVVADVGLPDSLAAELRQIQMLNHLRLHDYRSALTVADALLANPSAIDSAELADVQNMRRIFHALADVPGQTVDVRAPVDIQLNNGWMPLEINGRRRTYVFDTGANLSTIMRSEAEAVGVRVIPAGIDVGTSTDIRITADLGVVNRLSIGGMLFSNVVFLVLDDELLTFPDFNISGIVGFPVIEEMGEVRLSATSLSVPAEIPDRAQRNLALTGLRPLTQVVWGGQILLCQLDTGATHTELYEPFYRRYSAHVNSVADHAVRLMGGAGGIREIDVRLLRDVELTVGDTTLIVDSLNVLTRSITETEDENYLDCNIGHDILDAFPLLIVNFRDMAFLLQ